jgi:chaperone BCS1
MFYGEPGCGKSSFIWALASKFGKNLKIVDISTVRSANDLQSILAYNTKSFIIFEDIDAMGADVNARDTGEAKQPISDGACEAAPEPAKPISMSSLLNVFDGLNTPDGAICFFTTNHIDRLDPALVRDGRIDVKLKIGKVQGTELINNIASNLLDEADLRIFKERLRDDILITPATVQCLLMDYPIDVAIDKINNHGEL